MGTWSAQPFGNDTAADWAWGLDDSKDFAYIEAALDTALANAEEYLEAPEAEEAVAAIATLAKLQGNEVQSDSYTESADRWIASIGQKPSPALLGRARAVIDAVLGQNSELRELWEESGDAGEWLAAMASLKSALTV